MGVIDLPELCAVVSPVSSDAPVGPTAQDDLLCECRTVGVDAGSLGDRAGGGDTPGSHGVVVGVPESDCSVF